MKKTAFIRLALITATLAGCNRPLYTQAPPEADMYQGEPPDSTNSCPVDLYDLPPDYYNWYYSFRPFLNFYIRPGIEGFYRYRIAVSRHGFGHTFTKVGS